MRDLELMLSEVGRQIDWPATPDLASALTEGNVVRAQSEQRSPRRGRRSRHLPRSRSLALGLSLLVVCAAAAYAASPGLRDVIRDFLGVDSVDVERVPRLPPAEERPLIAGLGDRAALDAARRVVDFTPLLPDLGRAPQVYAAGQPLGGRISFVYPRGSDPPLLVSEFRGAAPRTLLRKLVGPGTRVERLRIAGNPAIWLSGRPHSFLFADAAGEIREERLRLAGSTLIWVTGGLVVRIEGARSRAEAIRIARGLR